MTETIINIPQDLKDKALFFLVRDGTDPETGKQDKCPYKCQFGEYEPAKSNDRETFSSFYDAFNVLFNAPERFTTLGVSNLEYVSFIDLDHCVKDGVIDPEVQKWINHFNTYAEFSISGDGIHLYFTCTSFTERSYKTKYKIKKSSALNCEGDVECYLSGVSNKCAIMTGNQVEGSPDEINDISDKIKPFLDRYLLKEQPQPVKKLLQSLTYSQQQGQMTSEEVIDLLEKDPNDYGGLFRGCDSALARYNYDLSRADQALANKTAFYAQGDFRLIEQIMRQSGICRDGSHPELDKPNKWNNHPTYLRTTIDRAIASCNGVYYDPNYRNGITLISTPVKDTKEVSKIENFEEEDDYIASLESIEADMEVDSFDLIEANEEMNFIDIPKEDMEISKADTLDEEVDLGLITASETKVRPVEWLWYPYLARGCITILCAKPGSGKSFFAIWLAAQITKGAKFPLNDDFNDHSGNGLVFYLSNEDMYDRTIVPRFNECGGVGNKFQYPNPDHIDKNGKPVNKMPATFNDPKIDAYLSMEPELIVFDVMSSFAGNTNLNSAPEVRELLTPLSQKIRKTNTSVLIIHHDNKMTTVTDAMDRVSGSRDVTGVIRTGLTFGENPFNKEQRILAQFKSNLGILGDSLGYEFVNAGGKEIPHLEFNEVVNVTANQLFGEKIAKDEKIEHGIAILEDYINQCEERGEKVWVQDARNILEKQGYSHYYYKKIVHELGLERQIEGANKAKGQKTNRYYLTRAEQQSFGEN